MLMRGPYAYLGAGVWGMTWPVGASWAPLQPTLPRPPALDADYGAPTGPCTEDAHTPGVFTRTFTNSVVTIGALCLWHGTLIATTTCLRT